MKNIKLFEHFPGSGVPSDYQTKTGDMSGDYYHMHVDSEKDDTTIKSEVNNELLQELIQVSKHVQLKDESEIEVVEVDDLRHILEKYKII